LPVVLDVVDGELDDPGGRLGEQQQQAGGDAGAQVDGVVGQDPAGPAQAAVLTDRRDACARRAGWLLQARGVSAALRPAQEDLRGPFPAGDVPAVQVGLRHGAQWSALSVVIVHRSTLT
jgi:hypothetical protein